jgi:Sec-independent protein translocase protein TatA
MGRSLGRGMREFRDSVAGDAKEEKLTIPEELTREREAA